MARVGKPQKSKKHKKLKSVGSSSRGIGGHRLENSLTMASSSAKYRAKMKKEDPERYCQYLEENRRRNQAYREAQKKRWEEEPHTRAQIEAHERKKQAKRDKEAERYKLKKAQQVRQTRTSLLTAANLETPGKKRRKDMSEDERRAHDSANRKKLRDARSSPKKIADNMKQRQWRREQKEKIRIELEKAVTTITRERLPKKAYNLNYEYKARTKEMGLSHEQYAQMALNLTNPKTPEKRTTISQLQATHPCNCKVLFQEPTIVRGMEEELGIALRDNDGGKELMATTNPTHAAIKEFYQQEMVSRILPHARYTTKYGVARVMVMTIKDAHMKFKDLNPSLCWADTFSETETKKCWSPGFRPN